MPIPPNRTAVPRSKSFVVDAVKSELLVHHDSLGRMETISMVRLDDVLKLERLDVGVLKRGGKESVG